MSRPWLGAAHFASHFAVTANANSTRTLTLILTLIFLILRTEEKGAGEVLKADEVVPLEDLEVGSASRFCSRVKLCAALQTSLLHARYFAGLSGMYTAQRNLPGHSFTSPHSLVIVILPSELSKFLPLSSAGMHLICIRPGR